METDRDGTSWYTGGGQENDKRDVDGGVEAHRKSDFQNKDKKKWLTVREDASNQQKIQRAW